MKFFFLLVGLIAYSYSFSAVPYKITVKVKGLKDSTCYLVNYYGDKRYYKDTAKADENGKIIFEGKEPLPGGVYSILMPGKQFFELIIDKEQNFSIEIDYTDLLNSIKIKGSLETELFYNNLKLIANVGKEAQPLKELFEKLNKEGKKKDSIEIIRKQLSVFEEKIKVNQEKIIKEYPETFVAKIFKTQKEPVTPKDLPTLQNGKKDSSFAYKYFKAHYFDNIDFSDERLLRTPLFHNKLDYYFKNLVVQTPDSINLEADKIIAKAKNKKMMEYIVWYISHTSETSKIMGMEGVLVHMVEKYYTLENLSFLDSASLYRTTAKAKALKPLLIGKKAPPLVLEDTLGKFHSLYEIKSKYTILIFWDPDCGHCKKEVPLLSESYDKLKAKGVEVFSVMCTPEADKWKKFIRDHKLRWIDVGDPGYHNYFRTHYDLNMYPQMYILNKDKEIIARKIGPEQAIELIDRLEDMEIQKKLRKDIN